MGPGRVWEGGGWSERALRLPSWKSSAATHAQEPRRAWPPALPTHTRVCQTSRDRPTPRRPPAGLHEREAVVLRHGHHILHLQGGGRPRGRRLRQSSTVAAAVPTTTKQQPTSSASAHRRSCTRRNAQHAPPAPPPRCPTPGCRTAMLKDAPSPGPLPAPHLLEQLLALLRLLAHRLRQHHRQQVRLLGAQRAADHRRVGARRARGEDVVALRSAAQRSTACRAQWARALLARPAGGTGKPCPAGAVSSLPSQSTLVHPYHPSTPNRPSPRRPLPRPRSRALRPPARSP